MEKVVYILGAGFSAPLGLPVMSNFLEKAKDMYISDIRLYSKHARTFEKINELSYIKNYYHSDLFNIEELFSILEMQKKINGEKSVNFESFIKDVINYCMPNFDFDFPSYLNRTIGFQKIPIFNSLYREKILEDNYRNYMTFTACIHNVILGLADSYKEKSTNKIKECISLKINSECPYIYSIITLNYDTILEKFTEILNCLYHNENGEVLFNKTIESNYKQSVLAKLHGCTTGKLVPPTWYKNTNVGIQKIWKIAYNLLSEANHIRIIGYSLPVTDSYVKYLFKSAILDSKNKKTNLKSIHIICKDDNGVVENRYDNFINFPNKKFINLRAQDYLFHLANKVAKAGFDNYGNIYMSPFLEEVHKDLINGKAIDKFI